MNKDILVIGTGFLGSRLQNEFDCAATARMIHSFEDAYEEVERYAPRVIINCIGYTGKANVDDCETDKDTVLCANTFVPIILAEVALRRSIKLVHISSGCIYHYDYGCTPPITEDRTPDFFDLFYSRSKIYAERALSALYPAADILTARLRIPLDNKPHPKNVLDKLLRYKKIIDVPNSVSYIPDFIAALKHLLRVDAHGTFNVVNAGGLYYAQLMEMYKKYVPACTYEVIAHTALNLVRTNLIMSVEKLEQTGFHMRPIQEVLEECVRGYLGKY